MWPNPQFPADLVTFTEEILNGKPHFLCIVSRKPLKFLELEASSRCPPKMKISIIELKNRTIWSKNFPFKV